jgi:DNA polymerase-4
MTMSVYRKGCVLHLDVDAFFAAVEQRDNERLRGRPVAVGTGVVASCSYEARRWGVATGMRLTEARARCRQLIVVPGDYRRYEIAARRILGICHDLTPIVELAALDDLYLDLAPRTIEEEPAKALARQLGQQVGKEVGLRVSLGLGTNKLVAAVATQELKQVKARALPGTEMEDLFVVPAGREREYLAPWPVEVLPGVGPKITEELGRLNVRRVAELAEVPLSVLFGLFGKRGKSLRDLAHGEDNRPVSPARPAQSVSRCTSFDPPISEVPFLAAMLDHLLERAALWLRLHAQAARGLAVRLRYADHQSVEARVTLSNACDDEATFKPLAREKLVRLYTRRLPLRLVGAELSPLQAADHQGDLFPEPEQERQLRLRACKDNIRKQFGFLAVTSGTALELKDRLDHDRDNFHLRTPCLTR